MKNIFLIPTKGLYRNRGVLFADSLENGKLVKNFYDRNIEWKDCAYYHIYITSDLEIKVGDWALWFGKDNQPFLKKVIDERNGEWLLSSTYDMWVEKNKPKKIILTTDQDLIADGVQAINNEFFDWFVENATCEFVDVIKEMYVPQSNGKISDGRISHEISLNPSDNTLPFYKIIIPQEELIMFNKGKKYIQQDGAVILAGENGTNGIIIADPKKMWGIGHYSDEWNPKSFKLLEEPKEDFTLEEAAVSYAVDVNTKMGDNKEAYQNCSRLDFIAGAKWQAEKMYTKEDMLKAVKFRELYKTESSKSLFEKKGKTPSQALKEWLEQFKNK